MSDEMRRVMDEAAIRRVIDRYCHAVDRGSADDVAALFHPNGRLVVSLEENDGYRRAGTRQRRSAGAGSGSSTGCRPRRPDLCSALGHEYVRHYQPRRMPPTMGPP